MTPLEVHTKDHPPRGLFVTGCRIMDILMICVSLFGGETAAQVRKYSLALLEKVWWDCMRPEFSLDESAFTEYQALYYEL